MESRLRIRMQRLTAFPFLHCSLWVDLVNRDSRLEKVTFRLRCDPANEKRNRACRRQDEGKDGCDDRHQPNAPPPGLARNEGSEGIKDGAQSSDHSASE